MRAQLLAALEESLTATPDPADVLRGIHAGVDRRRRRNHYYRTGFAIAAIVLVLIASLVAASVNPIARNQTPATIPVGEWKSSIELTWLPPDMTVQAILSAAVGESVMYEAKGSILSVFADNLDRERNLDEPGWQRTEINGRPARERSSENLETEISLLLPSGRWVDLSLHTFDSRGGHSGLREDALRVARGLRESGDLRLRARFAPSYLPVGQHVVGVQTDFFTPGGNDMIVCVAGSLQLTDTVGPLPVGGFSNAVNHRLADVGAGVRISVTDVPTGLITEQIADIQGRPAYRSISGGAVVVEGFHGSTLVVAATRDFKLWPAPDEGPSAAPLPLTELIRIAEGVRWIR